MVQNIFIDTVLKYKNDKAFAASLWSDIEKKYSNRGRYYHNLSHIENLFKRLVIFKDKISDWDTMLFSIVYHDVVYNPVRKDNEEKSAVFAKGKLEAINYPAEKINRCVEQVLATKSHSISTDFDTNLFTDADLSILGATWDYYIDYANKVRREYSIYPDLLYKPGREKVLQHFLAMERIFKTQEFYELYEEQARRNLSGEIDLL